MATWKDKMKADRKYLSPISMGKSLKPTKKWKKNIQNIQVLQQPFQLTVMKALESSNLGSIMDGRTYRFTPMTKNRNMIEMKKNLQKASWEAVADEEDDLRYERFEML